MKSQAYKNLILIIPVILLWYLGLFLTVALWYPAGLSWDQWQQHVLQFSIIYIFWAVIFFIHSLFQLQIVTTVRNMISRITAAMFFATLVAIVYFYFQPELLLTPRRFLLVHVLISSVGIFAWYWFVYKISSRLWQSKIFAHGNLPAELELERLVAQHGYSGLVYSGLISEYSHTESSESPVVVVLPPRTHLDSDAEQDLFALRKSGIQFVEYYDLHERLTRTIHLSVLSELWFIGSVDYGSRRLSDLAKRIMDILLGLVGFVFFLISLPIVGALIKLTSRGPIFFSQARVGQFGKVFNVYKYRTMTRDSSSNTWAHDGQKVTAVGKILRATRLDEFPQSLNVLMGNMSIVGPRPEQVNIVEELRQQIPYYDERHIVKPGLTGWAQLHVYASSVEETKRKLQYDLYYIKHRSLLFDAEIILKTIYSVISFSGK